MERCSGCGVPLLIGRTHRWEKNGVISLKDSPQNRMVFFECEVIDEIFRGIEKLIGVPIEHIVMESRSRETRRYVERVYPPEIKGMGGKIDDLPDGEKERLKEAIRTATQAIIDIGLVYGYGYRTLGDEWERGHPYPWRVTTIREPYSVLFAAADSLGSGEVVEGREMWVRYEEVAKDTYRIETFPGEHPLELKERLKRKRYPFKPGDIEFERCPECGVPRDIGSREWDPERGVILDPAGGRRMAFFGPLGVDAVFDDLQAELGEAIPDAVIEAVRMYIRDAWSGEEWWRDAEAFRRMIALRGLGNLVRFRGDRGGLSLTIENSAIPLPMVGAVQALVEMAYRAENSTVEWDLAVDGDLTVEVRVR